MIDKWIIFFLSWVLMFGNVLTGQEMAAAEEAEGKEQVQAETEKVMESEDNGQETEIKPSIITAEKEASDIVMERIVFPAGNETEQIRTLRTEGRGGLYLALASADIGSFQSLKLQVYSDAAMKKKIGKTYTVKSDTKVISTQSYYLAKKGTYYLKFTYTGLAEQEGEKAFAMTAAFMYSTNRTLTEGENLATYADAKQRAVYYKIKLKKDGLISYTAVPEDGKSLLTGHIQLCDGDKQPISVSEYVSGSKDRNHAVYAYYAVKKGTYYVKAKLSASYIVGFTLEKVKDTAGSDMAGAGRLKTGGREENSVIYLSDQADTEKWYRFRLKKNQNFSIVVNSCVNGYLNIEVCNRAGNIVKSGSVNFYTGTKVLKTSSKWQKGLYYIKVSKGKKSAKSSGYFSIKVET